MKNYYKETYVLTFEKGKLIKKSVNMLKLINSTYIDKTVRDKKFDEDLYSTYKVEEEKKGGK